jgi:hypothetical protein
MPCGWRWKMKSKRIDISCCDENNHKPGKLKTGYGQQDKY